MISQIQGGRFLLARSWLLSFLTFMLRFIIKRFYFIIIIIIVVGLSTHRIWVTTVCLKPDFSVEGDTKEQSDVSRTVWRTVSGENRVA